MFKARAPALALLYVAALAYLSLIPFDFHPQPMEAAWRRFLATPFLSLGLFDRADWIANLVAYVPLGFLLAAALDDASSRARIARLIAAVCIGVAVAVAIEYVQLFFAPRTVSLNDLLAEALGALAGVAAWAFAGDRIEVWHRALTAGGGRSVRALLWAYAVFYLLVGLFPFDFIASADELAWKLGSDTYGLLFAPGQCKGFLGCTLRLGTEVLASAPLGWLLASRRSGRWGRVGAAVIAGAILGIALEGLQFFLVSGQSQGVSVLTRAMGFALGAAAQRHLRAIGIEAVVRWGRVLSLVGLPAYLFLLAYAAGWVGATPIGPGRALARLPDFFYLPFYYHYFAPEASAVASVVAYTALYAPVGVAGWLWLRWRPGGAALTTLVACVLAALTEFSKIFLPGKHPDFTDVLIGGLSAWLAFRALRIATRPEAKAAARSLSEEGHRPGGDPGAYAVRAPTPTRQMTWTAGALALAAIVVWSVADFPALRLALAAALAGYAVLLARRPQAWLVVLPALLPVLDFAPWTGRLFWDEFDLFVLTTLAVRFVVRPAPRERGGAWLSTRTPVAIVLACTLASAAIGLFPLPPLDANAFSSYHSHYNALRAAKGVLWASALFFVMRSDAIRGTDVIGLFAKGLVVGLGTAALAIAWERATFTGLLDASREHRVTGLFSAMHIGGAYAESFLIAALPFALHAAFFSRSMTARVGSAVIFGAGSYALAATFSRTAYVAFAVEVIAFVGVLVWTRRRFRPGTGRLPYWVGAGTVAALLLLTAVPVALGPYASSRFAGIANDAPGRLGQWALTARLFEPRPTALLFGMGLGRFPERFLWDGPPAGLPGTFRFESEGENGYLRLGGGQELYFDQFVSLAPWTAYTVSFDARGLDADGTLAIALCEKLILYSHRCVWLAVPPGQGKGPAWARYEVRFNSENLGDGAVPFRRPVKISLSNSGGSGRVDVDNISVRGADGIELVRNGDFSAGMDRWLFTANDFWPWHIENMFIHTLFEQGIAGLLALLALIAVALGRSLSAPRADGLHVAYAASIAGLLSMGALNSVINAPRLALLFYLVMFSALLMPLGLKGSAQASR